MGLKKSNTGKTMLILLSVVIVLLILMQILVMITAISIYRTSSIAEEETDDIEDPMDAAVDAFVAMCGICFFWPVVLLYTGVAFGLTLIGRDIYGKKHSVSTIIGFVAGIAGVVFSVVGTFLSMIIFGFEVGLPVSITIPIVLMSVGIFFYIKDVGGLIWGAVGTGITGFSQIGLCSILIIILNSDNILDTRGWIIVGIIMIIITIIGLLLLGVGVIFSYVWMSKNEPLLDDQQSQQLQMQQQQLKLQEETVRLQRQTYEKVSQGERMEYIPESRQKEDQNLKREWEDD